MPRQSRRHRVARGIFRDDLGYAVRVEIAKHREEKRYPLTADVKAMKAWQEERRVELRRRHKARTTTPGTFADDARRYLEAVKAMPSYVMRAADIALWSAEFGHRRRHTVTGAEIAAVLHRWATEPRGKEKKPYAASTVNHRRTAILHLYTTLDGPTAENPVRAIKKFREPDPQPRGYTYATIRRILSKIRGKKSPARLGLIAYTGIPPAQIMRIDPDQGHVELHRRRVFVQGRRKGGGTKGRWYPLTPAGVDAIKAWLAAKATGTFSTSSLRKAWILACQAAGVKIGRPYDLRHSFATEAYRVSEQRAAQELLDHRDPRTSWRYIMGAISQHISKALPKLAAAQRSGAPKRGTRRKAS
ncbi:MAG TPA: site-specific integrase [Usitatibacter sp.]|jgi:integrase|nr:site-specific integrase [Usitatibacter sp.]